MKVLAINYNYHCVSFKNNCGQSPIDKAVLTSRKFRENGFRDGSENLFNFVTGELDEFKRAVKNEDRDNMEEELGDILFDTIMLADSYNINPTKALERTNAKINNRFNVMNSIVDKPILSYSYPERLKLWDKAKFILNNSLTKVDMN